MEPPLGTNGTHLKLRGQNIDPFMGSISFNPYRGQINHDLGSFSVTSE